MLQNADKNDSQMLQPLLNPEEQVLTTLEKDGSRHWMKPRLAHGFFLRCRRITAYVLIGLFTLLPFWRIHGKQALLLDVANREFTFFGFTFYPTDTLLLAIFGVGLLVAIFLLTSLFGRIWCGWACPQTVYMEFVFRPLERLFEGTAGRGGKARKELTPGRWIAKYAVYFAICFYLANTFLAYFVGTDVLLRWVRMSPLSNPVPFLIVATVTFFMMFNFCFFREQLCILACPYGRFQSVLLDQNSLIIAYDRNRGEPRGKLRKKADTDSGLPVIGDCVDCHKCVTVCPTGIDIRDGLQMECINCTQCIDACNEVMKKIGRAPGLIRYSSQAEIETGKRKLIRPRVILYPVFLLILVSAFIAVLLTKQEFTATLVRGPGNQFLVEAPSTIRNQLRVRLLNRTDEVRHYTIRAITPNVAIDGEVTGIEVPPGKMRIVDFSVRVDHQYFVAGSIEAEFEIRDDKSEKKVVEKFHLLGPVRLPAAGSDAKLQSSKDPGKAQ